MERLYLAARYSRRLELVQYRRELQARGLVVTSRWLNGAHQIDAKGTPIGDSGESLIEDGAADCATELREAFATEDVADVLSADTLIAFTEPPRTLSASRGGRHVEFGIAVATQRRIVIIGPRENIFCWLPGIDQFDSWDEFLSTIGEVNK